MKKMSSDERWMHRALELAARGRFTTWPNPMVGCVVVSENRSIGEGWHAKFGHAHAEVNALNQIHESVDLFGATAYITLEPCSHTGKTPPCADLLVSRGIGRVVVATMDPNPRVAGSGVSRLRSAGIDVQVGCLEQEACFLNRAFMHAMTSTRPWVTLKWAESPDGFMDPEPEALLGRGSHMMTGRSSGRHTHGLRAQHDGILVGMKTWLVDSPSLTTRYVPGENPKRFVLTSGKTKWIDGAPQGAPGFASLLCPKSQSALPHMESWRKSGYEVIGLEKDIFSEQWWENFKSQCGIAACLVEGGSQMSQGVLASNVWDELHVLQSNKPLHQGLKASSQPLWPPHEIRALGQDVLKVWRQAQCETSC